MMKIRPTRYQVVRITTEIKDTGRGITYLQIAKLCQRIKKLAKGKATNRTVSAVCGS